MTLESVHLPFQMCLSNLDRTDWVRSRIEGIGSETYHFDKGAKSDKYRGQTQRRKEQN
jgi:hypothetical protein